MTPTQSLVPEEWAREFLLAHSTGKVQSLFWYEDGKFHDKRKPVTLSIDDVAAAFRRYGQALAREVVRASSDWTHDELLGRNNRTAFGLGIVKAHGRIRRAIARPRTGRSKG